MAKKTERDWRRDLKNWSYKWKMSKDTAREFTRRAPFNYVDALHNERRYEEWKASRDDITKHDQALAAAIQAGLDTF